MINMKKLKGLAAILSDSGLKLNELKPLNEREVPDFSEFGVERIEDHLPLPPLVWMDETSRPYTEIRKYKKNNITTQRRYSDSSSLFCDHKGEKIDLDKYNLLTCD
jgi:hypothetical protein